MVKGGVCASLSTVSRSAATSISPVGILGFLASRSITRPVTWITNSRPSFAAVSRTSAGLCSSTTICVMPYRSRRSTKVMAPRLRTFCTHPARVTVSFTCSARSEPHVWVLYMAFFGFSL